jgi:FtsH-binding integral membrane protein
LVFHPDRNKQYLGLGLYVILEAIIFLPMIAVAVLYSGSEMIMQAAMITLFMFSGLTAVVFMTKTDFSFLRTALTIGGFIALGIIVAGAIFGFNLGLWFSVGMVVLASGSILYQTSQIKDKFSTDQYVGASLQLFASIMLLFWYVLRILMSRK